MNILRPAALLAILLLSQSDFAQAGAMKNQQNILGGVLTRAGVSGQDQLSNEQLGSLCEQGYSNAFFLYSGAAPRTVSCSRGRINYRSVSWLNPAPVLQAINAGLQAADAYSFTAITARTLRVSLRPWRFASSAATRAMRR